MGFLITNTNKAGADTKERIIAGNKCYHRLGHIYFCVVLCIVCIFVLFYVLFVLCRSAYCLCVNVHCTTATGWLSNCSEQIYHTIYAEGKHITKALTLILRRSRTGTVWFYTSTSNKRAARPKLYTKSLTRDLKLMYSRLTLVRISINL